MRVSWDFDRRSHNGVLGDSRHASYEAGESMVEAVLDDFEDVLNDIVAIWN